MDRLRGWLKQLRTLVTKDRVERELDEEVAFHLQMETDRRVREGLSPGEAERAARLLAALRPGADGAVLELGSFRATFLPQVWEQVPEPRQFLAALKQKAGVPQGWWGSGARAWRYTVTKWTE
jgi:hypothetical protein